MYEIIYDILSAFNLKGSSSIRCSKSLSTKTWQSHLVIDQHLCSGVRVRQPGDGFGRERICPKLRLIPAPALCAGESGAAITRGRISLHHGRCGHGLSLRPLTSWSWSCCLLRPPLSPHSLSFPPSLANNETTVRHWLLFRTRLLATLPTQQQREYRAGFFPFSC